MAQAGGNSELHTTVPNFKQNYFHRHKMFWQSTGHCSKLLLINRQTVHVFSEVGKPQRQDLRFSLTTQASNLMESPSQRKGRTGEWELSPNNYYQ